MKLLYISIFETGMAVNTSYAFGLVLNGSGELLKTLFLLCSNS